jgi:hypothetical protein
LQPLGSPQNGSSGEREATHLVADGSACASRKNRDIGTVATYSSHFATADGRRSGGESLVAKVRTMRALVGDQSSIYDDQRRMARRQGCVIKVSA